MLDYLAFVLDKTGHVTKRHEFRASDDAAALKHAHKYVHRGHDVEVRHHERVVGLLRSEKRGV